MPGGCDWGLVCLVNRRLAGPQGLWVTGLVLAPTPGQPAEKEEWDEFWGPGEISCGV